MPPWECAQFKYGFIGEIRSHAQISHAFAQMSHRPIVATLQSQTTL
jgi:hypothetical protein